MVTTRTVGTLVLRTLDGALFGAGTLAMSRTSP